MMRESSVQDIRLSETRLTLTVQICRPGFLLTLLNVSSLSSLIIVLKTQTVLNGTLRLTESISPEFRLKP